MCVCVFKAHMLVRAGKRCIRSSGSSVSPLPSKYLQQETEKQSFLLLCIYILCKMKTNSELYENQFLLNEEGLTHSVDSLARPSPNALELSSLRLLLCR